MRQAMMFSKRGTSAAEVQAAIAASAVDPLPYDAPYPDYLATSSSAPTANTLYLMEAANRATDLTVGVMRFKVGDTTGGNCKVCVYTYDGTTWTLLGSSASTVVGPINTVQAVSLTSAVVVPRGVRRFYGIVADGAAKFNRMAGTDPALGFIAPRMISKASSFTLPASFVIGDVSSSNIMPYLMASAS